MLQRIFGAIITGFLTAQEQREKVLAQARENGRKLDRIIELLTEPPASTPVATILTVTKE